jgi:hypothetical protein
MSPCPVSILPPIFHRVIKDACLETLQHKATIFVITPAKSKKAENQKKSKADVWVCTEGVLLVQQSGPRSREKK